MDEKKLLVKEFSDSSRKSLLMRSENTAVVHHKFTEDGDIVDSSNFNMKRDVSRLNITDLKFLSEWRKAKWDEQVPIQKLNLTAERAKRIIKKVSYFKTEDAKVKALADIPTPEWISAKDVENVYENGTLNDSTHKSLDRLAKITGAFKTTEVNLTQNVFNLPALSPDIEAKFKIIAEEALEAEVI